MSSTCFGPLEAGDGRAGKSAMAHGGSIAGLMAKWSEHNGDGLEVEVISSLALPDFGKPHKNRMLKPG